MSSPPSKPRINQEIKRLRRARSRCASVAVVLESPLAVRCNHQSANGAAMPRGVRRVDSAGDGGCVKR